MDPLPPPPLPDASAAPPTHPATPPRTPTPPPIILRTPSDIRPDPDGSIRWYRPSLGTILRHMGWRIVLVVPLALLLLATGLLGSWGMLPQLLVWGAKLWILAIGGAVALFAWAVGQAVRHRADPFCIHCGYTLLGLPDHHRCPECGRPYSLALVAEYRRDPHWFVQRWKTTHPVESPPIAALPSKRRRRDGT